MRLSRSCGCCRAGEPIATYRDERLLVGDHRMLWDVWNGRTLNLLASFRTRAEAIAFGAEMAVDLDEEPVRDEFLVPSSRPTVSEEQ